jgi:hypothetical protein
MKEVFQSGLVSFQRMGNLLPKDGIFGCRSISVPLWDGGSDGRGSATLHGETCCLENAGRLPASVYKGATMVHPL